MTLKLIEERKQKFATFVPNFLKNQNQQYDLQHRLLAMQFLASQPCHQDNYFIMGVLETDKIVGLKRHRQNYDAETDLSNEAYSEPVWWKHNIKNSFKDLVIPKPDITIFKDASETDWGIADGHNPSGGQWAEPERMHVNVLGLKTAFIGIRLYCQKKKL